MVFNRPNVVVKTLDDSLSGICMPAYKPGLLQWSQRSLHIKLAGFCIQLAIVYYTNVGDRLAPVE